MKTREKQNFSRKIKYSYKASSQEMKNFEQDAKSENWKEEDKKLQQVGKKQWLNVMRQ